MSKKKNAKEGTTVQTPAPRGGGSTEAEFAIGKDSFTYIAIGVGILIVGFMLMAGGRSDDPNVFNYEIFSFRRITLAPIIVVSGFMFVIWAIMRKPKE